MLIKNMKADGPMTITVGDTTFKLMKIGDRNIRVGIKAPRHLSISFDEDEDGVAGHEGLRDEDGP